MSAYDAHAASGSRYDLEELGEGDPAALHVLESSVDFMTLFYGHVVACPPHGPFVYYAAMTLVERARRRYASALAEEGGRPGAAAASSGEVQPGVYPIDGDGAAAVLQALTIPNVLALMENRYDTRHLASWPLLYVPAEIRGTDVAALIQQQQQQQQREKQQ